MNKEKLQEVWEGRRKLRAKAEELRAKADKPWREAEKLSDKPGFWGKERELRAKGNKLWAKGNKPYTQSNKLWNEAIVGIDVVWLWRGDKQDFACKLLTGEIFEP